MTDTVIAENVVQARIYKPVFSKFEKGSMIMDAELSTSVTSTMKNMLGQASGVTTRIAAS